MENFKEKINEKTNIEELELDRIKLESKINIVNHPVLYLTMTISILSAIIAISKKEGADRLDVVTMGICVVCIIATLVLLIVNEVRASQNKKIKYKIGIIKLRIQKLKDEESSKKRELELNKILKQENKDLIKIINFLGIK